MALVSAVAGTMYSEQPKFMRFVTCAFPNPYTVGGEALDWEDYLPDGAVLLGALDYNNATYQFRYNVAAKTVQAFVLATGVEAGAIDLTGQTGIVITFIGA